MKYDEFIDKLKEVVMEFENNERYEDKSIQNLLKYASERGLRRPRGGGAKSLKGFNL
jgi:hypothetical protein